MAELRLVHDDVHRRAVEIQRRMRVLAEDVHDTGVDVERDACDVGRCIARLGGERVRLRQELVLLAQPRGLGAGRQRCLRQPRLRLSLRGRRNRDRRSCECRAACEGCKRKYGKENQGEAGPAHELLTAPSITGDLAPERRQFLSPQSAQLDGQEQGLLPSTPATGSKPGCRQRNLA
jgi:hypothetical protein